MRHSHWRKVVALSKVTRWFACLLATGIWVSGCSGNSTISSQQQISAPPVTVTKTQVLTTSASSSKATSSSHRTTRTVVAPTTVVKTTAPPQKPDRPGPTVTDTELISVIHTGIAGVSSSWQKSLPEWPLPTIWNGDGLYDGIGRETWTDTWRQGPICNGEKVSAWNAVYCPPNDTVAWDLSFVRSLKDDFGTWSPQLVIAHEFGHAAQDRLIRAGQGYLVWPQVELQADCLAGAFLYQAAESGFLATSTGDPDEFYATQVLVSDAEAWQEPADHGNREERIAAFETGLAGVDACIWGDPPVIGESDEHFDNESYNGLFGEVVETRWSLVSPSGNIICHYMNSLLKCAILEHSFSPGCSGVGMPLLTLGVGSGSQPPTCAGLAIMTGPSPETTDYGDVVEIGPYICEVEESGVTCFNDIGAGFALSRASLELF